MIAAAVRSYVLKHIEAFMQEDDSITNFST